MTHSTRIMDTIIENLPIPWLPLPNTQSGLCDVAYTLQDNTSLQFDQDWKDLRFLPWRFFYLDYLHLQRMIQQHSNTVIIDRKLEDEWKKVHDFYMLKRGEIERRIESCHVNQQDKSTLQSISTDIHYLYHFAKLNYCGFLMLFTQFHRLFGPPIHGKLLKRISNNQSSDGPLLQLAVQMNSLYLVFHESDTTIKTTSLFHPMCSHVSSTQQEAININNQVGNCNKDNESASIQPLPPTIAIEFCETALPYDTQCYRTVKKYWIHPDNVVELLLCLSNKMIVKERQANPSSYCFKAVDEVGDPHPLKASQQQSFNKVTTLYLDAPQFDGYTDLVCNKDAASITRIRWYDEGNNAKSFTQLEKKTYDRERGFTQQQQWVQQRVWLKSKRLQPWLAGDYSIIQHFSKDSCQYRTNGAFTWQESDKQRMLETCLQIENQVHSKHKVPVLRVTKNRIVYASVDDSVSISIDTDIAMIKYHQQTLQDDYPYSSLGNNIVRFPYCIVQISATAGNNEPSWISDLTQCAMLEPVNSFSTYLHGVGTLFQDQVDAVPSWFSHDDDIRHLEARGQWLIGKLTEKEKTLLTKKSSSDSMTKHVLYCGTTDIATIVTCYDEEEKSPSSASSSNSFSKKMQPSSSSASLSPIPEHGLRRSFDSYCSFDHPTSSRSDPHNCRSCSGRMFIMKDTEEEDEYKVILPTSVSSTSIYQPDNPVTFGSFLFQTFLPRRFRSLEKEPLLGGKKKKRRQPRFEYSSTASSSSATLFDPHQTKQDEEFGQKKAYLDTGNEYSRATILTVTCVIMSFSISYVFYMIVLEKI